MKVDINYINKLLGLELKEIDAKKLFERMGYGYKNGIVLIPAYRADIIHQSDLAEDVAIAYGYENFEDTIPKVATIAEEDKFEIFKNKISDLLVGLEFLEVSTYNLTNEENQNMKMNTKYDLVHLKNSVSSDYGVLRLWIIPSIIEVLSNNKHHEYPQKIFGVGRIFKKNNKEETGIEEQDCVAAAIASENADYTDIRQIVDYILHSLDLNYEVKEAKHESFIEGRMARAVIKGKDIAYFGELNPNVLENWDLEMPVVTFGINLDELFKLLP